MAAIATFALKAGVWFRRGRLLIVSPDSLGTACPLSGRNSTYRPVQILEASSVREVMNGIMYILSTGCQWRAIPKDLPPRSTLFDYLDLWSYDGTLDRIHHALYVACREHGEREASPTAAIVDSQSVKSAEKGGPASIRMAMTRAKRSRARSAIFS
jgi:transposase